MPFISSSSMQSSVEGVNDGALVVLDAGVAWRPLLLSGLPASAEVLVLSPERDGVEQVTEALRGRASLSSLHLVAHGSPGALKLGKAQLDLTTLERHAGQLRAWSEVLEGCDVLVYGCRVAEGAAGRLFLEQVRALTGANIAASESRIGRDGAASNWTLEVRLGPVTAPLAFSEGVMASYPGHFETVTFSLSSDTMVEDENTPITFNFDITGEIPPGGTKVRIQAETPTGELITNAISQWDVFQLNLDGITFEDVSPNLDFTIFEFTITKPNASLSTVTFNDFVDDSPQTFVWQVTPVTPGTTVITENNVVTIYDTRSEVPPANTAPVASDDGYATDFETALVIDATAGVLGNDSDADGDALSVALDTGPANGSVTLNADGSFTYTPDAGFSGDDSFTYTVSDGNGGSDSGTVTVSVAEPPPLSVVGFTVDTTTLIEDEGTSVTFTFNVENLPPEGVTVALGVYRPGDSGSDLLERALGDFDFFPPAPNIEFSGLIGSPFGFNGNSGLAFTIGQDGATITLPISDDADIPPDAPGGNVNTDVGIEQQVWRLIDFSNANPPFDTVDDYVVAEGAGEATLTLRDTANFAPEAEADGYATDFETALVIDAAQGVLGNDSDLDGDTLTAALDTGPANGSVTLNADGSFTYTPDAGFSGDDSFTYTVSDGQGKSDSATVTVTVGERPNAQPVAGDDSYATDFETALVIDATTGVLGNDSDEDGDALSVALDAGPTNGSVTLNADGSFSYIPDAGFSGDDSFTYTVSDGRGGSDSATVTVTVGERPNAQPVAGDDSYATDFETALVIDAVVGVLANDSDADGDALSVALDTGPTNGSVTLNADGSFTYTPDAGFSGGDSFTYTVSDGRGGSDSGTVNVTVAEPPLPAAVTFSLSSDTMVEDENTPITFNFDVTGDIPPEGVKVRFQAETPEGELITNAISQWDVFQLNFDGIAFEDVSPNLDFTVFEFTITKPDASVSTVTFNDFVDDSPQTFVWQVTPVTPGTTVITESNVVTIYDTRSEIPGENTPPIAEADSYAADFETALVIDATAGVLGNDNDADGDALSVALDTGPANGSVTLNADGSFTYTPDAGFSGDDSFTYTVSDGNGGSDSATVTVTVGEKPNSLPVAADDSYATDFETALVIDTAAGVLGNDSDEDGDALSVALDTGPANGSVTLNADGSFSYTPDAGFSGDDSFTYTVSDGRGGSDSATVTVAVGEAPVIPEVSLTADVLTLVEDEGTETTFTIALSEPPPAGGLVITIATGKPFSLGDFDIFPPGPAAQFDGVQLIRGYQDNSGLTVRVLEQTATITLPIFDDPDRPPEDPDATRNDDIGEEQTTFSLAFEDDLGQTFDGYTISPSAGSVTLTLKDTNNTAPVASDDGYATDFETALVIDAAAGVLGNDSDEDGDALSVALDTGPANGSVTLNADGSFSYTPDAGFSGDDSFAYTVSDGRGGSDTATVTVTVGERPNAQPVAGDDSYATDFETALVIDAAAGVLGNDSDLDGDTLTAVLDTEPANGSVTLNADGSFSYIPDAGFSGEDSFTYTASDGRGGSAIATVTVTVGEKPNTAPLAAEDTASTGEGSAVGGNVLANDSDPDGDPLTVVAVNGNAGALGSPVTLASGAILVLDADGTYSYDPNGQFDGLAAGETATDSFTYTVSDGRGGSATASVTVTVEGEDEEPTVDLKIGLYDAKTDKLITLLEDGDEVSASLLRSGQVTIAAFVPEDSPFAGEVESMFLDLNDGAVTKTENIEPYALFGDWFGNFRGGNVPIGENTISFDLYSENFLRGDLLGSVTRSFTIVDEDVEPSLKLDIGLYDAKTDTLIAKLEEGAEISASLLAGKDVTIAAFVPEESFFFGKAESMRVELNDGAVTKVENVEPYALFGDWFGNFRGGDIPVGENSISFDIYSKNLLRGDYLGSVDLDFTIVDDIEISAEDLEVGLYDARSDELIAKLEDGAQVSASLLAGKSVTIAALVPEDSFFFGKAESMRLDLNDGEVTRTQSVEPYALFGDWFGDLRGGALPSGENEIVFDVYAKDGLRGDLLGSLKFDFTITDDLV